MSEGGGDRLPREHPRLAGVPSAGAAPDADGPAHMGRERRQGAGPGRGLEGSGARARRTSSPWSCRRASAAASCSMAACWTEPPVTPATSATWSLVPDGHELPGHVRGVLESEASGTAIRHRTGLDPAEVGARGDPTGRTARRSGGRIGRQSPRSQAGGWWPAPLPSDSGSPSSRPPTRSSVGLPDSIIPWGPASCPPASALTAPSWVRPRWHGGPWAWTWGSDETGGAGGIGGGRAGHPSGTVADRTVSDETIRTRWLVATVPLPPPFPIPIW